MWIKNIVLIFIGLASGFSVAGGIFAFITMIGVINRLSSRTHTAKYLYLYETMIILGGTLGNVMILFDLKPSFGVVLLIIFGFFTGIFVGCLAMALAEVLKVIPIFASRIHLVEGISFVVLSLALGKGFGALYQLVLSK